MDAALYKGNELKITPAQIVRDISETQLKKDSLTAQYYDYWTSPNSFLRETFQAEE